MLLGRVSGVEGNIGQTSSRNGQKGYGALQAVVQKHGHFVASGHSQGKQTVAEAVCLDVHL